MKLVYLETFIIMEMQEQASQLEAQLMISEEKDGWQLMWTEQDEEYSEQVELWYEGQCWETLNNCLLDQLMQKLEQGFAPLYSMHHLTGKVTVKERNEILQFYSEENYNQQLYEQLREWRKQEALKRKIPLYVIATNTILKQISAFIPYTNTELMSIAGVGTQKVEEYGAEILKLTTAVKRTTEFPLNWVIEQNDQLGYNRWKLMNELRKLKEKDSALQLKKKLQQLLADGASLPELSKRLKLSTYRVLRSIEQCIDQGETNVIYPWLQSEINSMPSKQYERICEAYEKCGTTYLKPVMEAVKGTLESSESKEQIYDRLHLVRLEKKIKSS